MRSRNVAEDVPVEEEKVITKEDLLMMLFRIEVKQERIRVDIFELKEMIIKFIRTGS